MTEQHFTEQTKALIDSLKTICANYGLGNDGNEFKIISQAFLYKFLNDKYDFEVKKIRKEKPDEPIEFVNMDIEGKTAVLKPEHSIKYLSERQNSADFAKLFDDTLTDIAAHNAELFSVKTEGGAKIVLFERISQYITDEGRRDDFCRALISKLAGFSFETIFAQKFDFFATIFEYLIKDYNSNSGGKYAEYYTPHAVARIMADILVPEEVRGQIRSVDVYDPSAGSGTLLMNVAHAIGEDKCMIYTQDISQKSSNLLRLNLILNNLVHSLNNVVQGNTILSPAHKDASGRLKKFDFIVSNPPFKLDFSDFREQLESEENRERFFAGIPKIKAKDTDKMEIYQLFIQHILFSLKEKGKAAIVLPTGFITAQSGIDKKIREYLVENKMLAGVVSMPSNIFATTGTNVSILFIDNTHECNHSSPLLEGIAEGTTVYADKGYDSKENRQHLKEHQLLDGIMRKAHRNRPLTEAQTKRNRYLSKTRYVVEQSFGTLHRKFRYARAAYFGLIKVSAQSHLKAMCLNLLKAANRLSVSVAA